MNNDEFITLSPKVDFTSADDREKLQERYKNEQPKPTLDELLKDYEDPYRKQYHRIKRMCDDGGGGKGACLVKYNRDLDHSLTRWWAEKDRE